ncbi:hypothetical protein GOP47_0013707 [Adiantum capillus-veneris]|uniref:Uncharacterized protein n=1 Tax=Adiantum capillus-veneris TaxID=13818 RepID=A0A9D4ZG15_ADICA|nr:hypothetical protein GOP47_0013707 [Adiantum capillus-veneris]
MEEEYDEELEKLLGEIPKATSAPPHLEDHRTAAKDHQEPSSEQLIQGPYIRHCRWELLHMMIFHHHPIHYSPFMEDCLLLDTMLWLLIRQLAVPAIAHVMTSSTLQEPLGISQCEAAVIEERVLCRQQLTSKATLAGAITPEEYIHCRDLGISCNAIRIPTSHERWLSETTATPKGPRNGLFTPMGVMLPLKKKLIYYVEVAAIGVDTRAEVSANARLKT